MEKKKLLLVTISVGIFLVIAIGAAILVFAPKDPVHTSGTSVARTDTSPAAPESNTASPSPETSAAGNAGISRTNPVDAVEMVRNPQEVPGLKTPPEGTIPQGSDYYVNGTQGGSGNSETVISVPKPSTAAVPNTAPASKAAAQPAPVPKPAPTAAPRTVAQAAPKPAATAATQPAATQPAATQPAAAKPAATQPAATQPAESKPAAAPKVYDDFWVQTGAFSTVTKAEVVKETLSSKGITSIIENGNVDGQTLFRVRVGPYTSKNEADYWLSLIKSMNGFEESQVRQTQSRR